MKQFIQNLKTGELELKELPIPLCKSKGVLVRTVSSLVSVGTEKSIIDLAQKGLIDKARPRQAGEGEAICLYEEMDADLFIDKVKPLLDEIVSHGFRVADELYQEILIKADEIREQRE